MHFANSVPSQEVDQKVLGWNNDIQQVQLRLPKNGLYAEGKRTTMKVMKTVLYRGRVPIVIESIISLSTLIEFSVKLTRGIETGLR